MQQVLIKKLLKKIINRNVFKVMPCFFDNFQQTPQTRGLSSPFNIAITIGSHKVILLLVFQFVLLKHQIRY